MLYTVFIVILLVTLIADHPTALPQLRHAYARAHARAPWLTWLLRKLTEAFGWAVVDGITMHVLLPLSHDGHESLVRVAWVGARQVWLWRP